MILASSNTRKWLYVGKFILFIRHLLVIIKLNLTRQTPKSCTRQTYFCLIIKQQSINQSNNKTDIRGL